MTLDLTDKHLLPGLEHEGEDIVVDIDAMGRC